jgi:hypothetical protein
MSGGIDTSDLQLLATKIFDRASAAEQTINDELAAGRVPGRAAAINDALVRLEQTLLDAREPPATRWYRHVVYGWNIYSMYDGQPLPGLFEAIRIGDATAVAREQARIRDALNRMLAAVEALAMLIN